MRHAQSQYPVYNTAAIQLGNQYDRQPDKGWTKQNTTEAERNKAERSKQQTGCCVWTLCTSSCQRDDWQPRCTCRPLHWSQWENSEESIQGNGCPQPPSKESLACKYLNNTTNYHKQTQNYKTVNHHHHHSHHSLNSVCIRGWTKRISRNQCLRSFLKSKCYFLNPSSHD